MADDRPPCDDDDAVDLPTISVTVAGSPTAKPVGTPATGLTGTAPRADTSTLGATLGVPHGNIVNSESMRVYEGHWHSHGQFRDEEIVRKAANCGDISSGKLFLSHCWRMPRHQRRKRRFIAALSKPKTEGGPGLPYWADFIELQCNGPVEWQAKIENAIASCSKMVCFVDDAYIKSFNCLKEVAYAFRLGKPVVVVVLDGESWKLLTVPGGLDRAWDDSSWGTPLSAYENISEILDGEPFTKDAARKLFTKLASINLCPCRPLDEDNWGIDGVVSNLKDFVGKDITYASNHAFLQSRAVEWDSAGRSPNRLLKTNECEEWGQWLQFSEKNALHPPPTSIQKDLVAHSRRRAKMKRSRMWALAAVLLALILAGAVVSAIMAVKATQAEHQAEANAQEAAMWSILGSIREPRGTIYEVRALLQVLRVATRSGVAARDSYSGLAAVSASIFYKLMSRTSVNIGQIEGLARGWAVAWSPDGQRVAVTSEVGGNPVMVQDLYGGEADRQWLLQQRGGSPVHGLAWAQDGRLAAADLSGAVLVWDVSANSSSVLPGPSAEPMVPWTPVAWLMNSTAVVAASADGTLRMWDLTAGSPVRLNSTPGAPITDLSVSSDGQLLVTSRIDTSVDVWQLSGGAPTEAGRAMVGPGGPNPAFVDFAPGGITAAVSLWGGGKSYLYNVHTSGQDPTNPASRLGTAEAPSCKLESCRVFRIIDAGWGSKPWASSSPFEDVLDDFQQLQLSVLGWNSSSWEHCSSCRKNSWGGNVTSCVQDMYLERGICPLEQLALWAQLSEAQQLAAMNLGYTSAAWDATAPYSCCYGPSALQNQSTIALEVADLPEASLQSITGSDSPTIIDRVGSLSQGKARPESILTGHHSPDGASFAAGTEHGIVVWDLTGNGGAAPPQSLYGTYVNGLKWSPDSRFLASAMATGSLDIWDFNPDTTYQIRSLPPHSADTTTMAVSPDGSLIASASASGELHLYAMPDGALKYHVPIPRESYVNWVAWSPDGSRLAVGAQEQFGLGGPGSLYILNTTSWDLSEVDLGMDDHTPWVNSAEWSPDGNVVAASAGTYEGQEPRAVVLVEVSASGSSRVLHTLSTNGFPTSASFSPDGKLLAAVVTDQPVEEPNFHLWDVASGEEVTLGLPAQPFGAQPIVLSWSPVDAGRAASRYVLASSGGDGAVYLLHGYFHSGAHPQITKLEAHRDQVRTLRWDDSGAFLATGGDDGRLLIWSTADPLHAHVLQRIMSSEDGTPVLAVDWGAKGTSVVFGGTGGYVRTVVLADVADMAAILEGVMLPFTRTSFSTSDAAVLGLPVGAVLDDFLD